MRLMMEQVEESVAARQDFAVESTLSGRASMRHIPQWQSLGYHVRIISLWLPLVELAFERVAQRVAQRVTQGGHHIPEDVIRRRFDRGRHLFVRDHLCTNGRFLASIRRQCVATGTPPIGRRNMINRNDEIAGSDHAIIRAARRAAESARQHGQALILWQDGKIVRIKPEDLPHYQKRLRTFTTNESWTLNRGHVLGSPTSMQLDMNWIESWTCTPFTYVHACKSFYSNDLCRQ